MAYRNMTALVVEDFTTMRRIVRGILRDLRFKVVLEAEDGVSAVKVLRANKVDIIVSDGNMPRMTGIDLLRHVRTDSKLKDLPFSWLPPKA